MSRDAYVYLMTNKRNTVLYIGVTNDLVRRVAEHKLGLQRGFTQRYQCTKLVHFEADDSIVAAIQREKQLKNWRRAWKDELVTSTNPSWTDLGPDIGVTPEILALVARRDPGASPG
ncbi:GIY-YIG nuclease family protein [Micropruina sp.]|uniref:GIY-YIG nuclease family protein n=1 Tax=Micropruina sp. TaxID=2737536 RepID=UPI0039E414FD